MDNNAILLADITAPMFAPQPSPDEGLIRTAMEFTLQLTPGQLVAFGNYEMLAADENVNSTCREQIKTWLKAIERRLRYHNSAFTVMSLVDSMSWKSFAKAGFMSGNINMNKQG